MPEYIEREKAIAETRKPRLTDAELRRRLASIPAADVRPVVHGKWLRTPTFWAYCSVCGEEPPKETNITTNFCPNCGASMEES